MTPEQIILLDLRRKRYQKFDAKRQHAKKLGIQWNLQFSDVHWPEYCPILPDLKIDYFSNRIVDNSPSFDRIDNDLGYVRGNVGVISYKANRIKGNCSKKDIENLLKWLDNTNKSCYNIYIE